MSVMTDKDALRLMTRAYELATEITQLPRTNESRLDVGIAVSATLIGASAAILRTIIKEQYGDNVELKSACQAVMRIIDTEVEYDEEPHNLSS